MTYSSYEPGGFAVDIERLKYNIEKCQVAQEDFPAFIHEWCHYLQDITTISAQNGFYLWMRDLVCLTKITCSSDGEEIVIPLKPEDYGGYVNKYQLLYRTYCEQVDEERIESPLITKPCKIEVCTTDEFTEETRVYARCICYINHKECVLSLVALQEINAFYAQKVAEGLVKNVEFSVKADDMDTYPYHLGEILFNEYGVNCDMKMRFCITYMCLDTLQPPVIFLKTLEKLQGLTLDYNNPKDIEMVAGIIDEVLPTCSHTNEEAYHEIFRDYDLWLNDDNHQYLVKALKWYVDKIKRPIETQKKGRQIIPVMLCEDMKTLERLVKDYPVPLFKKDGFITPDNCANEEEALATMIFWMLKKVCALLVCQKKEHLKKYTECPFYKHCQYIDESKKYFCKTAFWEVIQGEKDTKCPFGIALHIMGLWQNKLVVGDLE
jgi:hypothetical protein